jgi:hypothetical protein
MNLVVDIPKIASRGQGIQLAPSEKRPTTKNKGQNLSVNRIIHKRIILEDEHNVTASKIAHQKS